MLSADNAIHPVAYDATVITVTDSLRPAIPEDFRFVLDP